MNGFAFGCTIAYLCRRYQKRSWQRNSLSTSKTFKAMKQNRSPTKSAERRLNKSVTYRSRIVSVSISYQSRIVLVSSSYRSPIVLASGSGNNTETIRKQYEVDICWKGGRYVVGTWWSVADVRTGRGVEATRWEGPKKNRTNGCWFGSVLNVLSFLLC